VTKYRALMNR